MTLNDSIDEEVEFDSMGNEISAANAMTKSKTSSSSENQNVLSKLIREKSIAILSMEQKAEIDKAVQHEFGFNDEDDFY